MNTKQKILIIGGGGREHAIGWKIVQSPHAGQIYFAPGNAGTAKIGKNIDIKATNLNELLAFAKEKNIDLTLAIPDDPLALGIVDLFKRSGLRIFGPTKNAAQLESSKAFAKNFMTRVGLPTAKFKTFDNYLNAKEYLKDHPLPVVIKVSGLALGKGVFICDSFEEASQVTEDILSKKTFGESGNEIVIEEFLTGPEVSIHAFSDGKSFSMFPTAQDHKRIGEGDTGPNTGGMGTVAPLPFVNDQMIEKIKKEIVTPTVDQMRSDNNTFEGIIYPGLILTEDGPKILEYNVRFGDPETQTYMRLLDSDLLEIIEACINEKLNDIKIAWKPVYACTVVLASAGYPGNYEKGKIISGVAEAEEDKNIIVFHAGTSIMNSDLTTSGGRVLGVSAIGKDLKEALERAYDGILKINFEGMQYRKDIGKKAML